MLLNGEKSCEVELGQRSKRILYWRRKVWWYRCLRGTVPFCVFYYYVCVSAIRFGEDKQSFSPRFVLTGNVKSIKHPSQSHYHYTPTAPMHLIVCKP
jgi:hypothetical protein